MDDRQGMPHAFILRNRHKAERNMFRQVVGFADPRHENDASDSRARSTCLAVLAIMAVSIGATLFVSSCFLLANECNTVDDDARVVRVSDLLGDATSCRQRHDDGRSVLRWTGSRGARVGREGIAGARRARFQRVHTADDRDQHAVRGRRFRRGRDALRLRFACAHGRALPSAALDLKWA